MMVPFTSIVPPSTNSAAKVAATTVVHVPSPQ
jgi:hypothetical protein